MSVYTSISDHEFSDILKNYSLGDFISSQGIKAGIENTNYFVRTTKSQYVFTLFEKISAQELTLYLSLLQEFSMAGIACPQPQADKNNHPVNIIKDKPFTFVTRLEGKSLTVVNASQCNAIATELAKLHTAPLSTGLLSSKPLQNRRGKTWRETTAKKLAHKLCAGEARLLSSEIMIYQSFDDSKLPKGIIHADLFIDNALFKNEQLSGVIDFYDACYDNYLYDIAITVNAWCTNRNGKLREKLVAAFFQGYQSIRTLTEAEINAWPIMLRIVAIRFCLSRLEGSFAQRQGDLTHHKNPNEYLRILQNHVNSSDHYREQSILTCG